jgi:hypothetical protein
MLVDFQIASVRNEVVRTVAGQLLKVAAPIVRMSLQRRIDSYAREQDLLRKRYGIERSTNITSWNPGVQKKIDRATAGFVNVRYAFTSGSTSDPKRFPYTSRRLRDIKRTSFEAVVQVARTYNITPPTLFVLSAIQKDDSLSSLLLENESKPSFLDGLIMPSRYTGHPGLEPVVKSHGPTAVRLCLLVLSNPSILYGTNPSTIASFLISVEHDWSNSSRLLRDIAVDPRALGLGVSRVLRKVITRGWEERTRFAASAVKAPSFQEMVPGLKCFCCWDGGYVKPFLDMIRRYLPIDQYVHIPMYSMSTECLQTQTFFVDGTPLYLPTAPGVLYEFLTEGAEDDPDHLLASSDLEVGRSYSMVVSDSYGLSRYQTDDVFLCAGEVDNIPDLRFLRRRGLAYSFTGEKITGKQVESLYARLRENHPVLQDLGAQMTLIPAYSRGDNQGTYPHYRLVIAYTASVSPTMSAAELSKDFDSMLADRNPEFASKRSSGRLEPTRALFIDYDRFARLMRKNDCSITRKWDNQFKLVPLYTRLWGELGLPPLENFE